MSLKDLANTHQVGQSIAPQTITSTTNGSGVDMRSTGPQVTAVLSLGVITGTSPTIDVKLQESDDNSTFTDISGATFSQKTDSNASSLEAKTFFNRAARYVRAVATIGGTTANVLIDVTLMARKTSQ